MTDYAICIVFLNITNLLFRMKINVLSDMMLVHFKLVYATPLFCSSISRKPQYKNLYRRTIEMSQRARTFQVNCCLKVHNAHLKLLSPISCDKF